MSDELIGGIGVLFQRGIEDSSGSEFEIIGGIENIDYDGLNDDLKETTELNQQDKNNRKKGIKLDAGRLILSIQFLFDFYNKLKTDFERGTPWTYRITLPDGSTTVFNFQAIVQNLPLSIDMNNGIIDDIILELHKEIGLNEIKFIELENVWDIGFHEVQE